MEAIEFEIEGAFEAGGRAYVVARVLDRVAAFEVSPGATLDGCPIEPWLEMPRAANVEGKQRTDLFGFCLAATADLERLKVGDHVVLS